jgi:PAS domain S-box-containing protein/putative nucleotidyltransferase with HDIG domain
VLFSSIASVRAGTGDRAQAGQHDDSPVGGGGAFALVSVLVRARLVCAFLLVFAAAAGAALMVFRKGNDRPDTVLVLVVLGAMLLLSALVLVGEVAARKRLSALTLTLDRIARGQRDAVPAGVAASGELGTLARTLDSVTTRLRDNSTRLEQMEAQFFSLCASLPGAAYIYSSCADADDEQDSTVVYVSPRLEELLGYSPEEWQADPTLWSQRIHPEDQARVLAEYTAACEKSLHFCSEYRMLAKEGRVVWVRDEARITREAGKDQMMFGMMQDISAQRKELLAVRDRGERFGGIIDCAREAIISTDTEGTITVINQGAQKILGFTAEELLGKPIDAIWSGDRPGSYTRQLADFAGKMYRTGKLGTLGEVFVRRKDGAELVMEATMSQYAQGPHKTLTVVMRNITERRRVETQIKASEASFRSMFTENPLPVWVYDLDTLQILEVNNAAEARYGYTREEFLAMRATDLKVGEDVPRLVGGNHKEPDGPYSLQVRHRRKDGQIIDVQLATQSVEFRGHRAALVVAEEITERKKAEEALRDSEQRFRAMFEGAAIGTALVDLDGRYIKVNPALERMLGYASDELLEMRMTQITHTEDLQRTIEPFKALVDGERDYYHQEQRYLRKDGTVVWANLTMSLVRGSKRRPQFCIAMIENITERKNSQEQIKRQLERLAALRNIDLTISSSLDLRVTLNVILEQVMSQLKVDATDVLLLNPHTQLLEYAAGRGFRYEGITRSRLRIGEGFAGTAALERRSVTIPDLREQTDDDRTHLLYGEDFVSYFAVPLLVKGQVKGVLEILNRSAMNPQTEWVDFLDALTSQAAIAIDNATMYNDLQRSNTELALAYDTTLEGWSGALDLRDKETEGHTQRVTEMTERLARAMGMSESDLVQVRRGALLHDIGKMGIPDSILLKPGPLTDEEWEIMRKHPVYAYELLSPITFLRPALDIPYCHHEKWDGTGYPRGLKGEQIPLSARIFAIVDVYDALRSDRPYRAAWSEQRVREHIKGLSGTHFDPRVVEAFLNMEMPRVKQTGPLGGVWEFIERKLTETGQPL